MKWEVNKTNIEDGKFRTINGNSDEFIAIGRITKAGFPCSVPVTTNGRYDAVVDIGNNKLIRIQIKGTLKGSAGFTGGGRSGKQISRQVKQRTYKYSKEDCDLILILDGTNGDCYLIPIEDIDSWGTTRSLSKLKDYRENWGILEKMARDTS
jgi:hypothetical protein